MKIITMGDSTMQDNDYKTYPQVGWIQALRLFVNIEIHNFAKNGCSTKSFIDFGYAKKAFDDIESLDYVLIEFGHNDQKVTDPTRFADSNKYKENLKYFIKSIKEKGGIPILLTPIYRRYFDDGIIRENVHFSYPSDMIEVALDENVLCIDMTTKTKNLLSSLGDENSKRLFMNFDKGLYRNYPDGLNDNTHLRFDGAYQIATIFYESLKELNHPLLAYFKTND